ncbi:hypothetical protein CDLVIII_1302 [Clostridium sp. DL-VIII]|nr:hypothetical protein [Clostridium sp. DL-VIII]EHI98001.1 hypothetical protein CDLVIII_1302 [Clostridium sp. DL-VIII]
MEENQMKKIKISNGKTVLKKMTYKELIKSSSGKRLVAFATLGCRKVN